MDDNFRKPVALYKRKDAANKFIEAILTENDYCKKVMKNYFNKNLVMSAEYKTKFQSSNKYWICNKLFVAGNDNVRYHDHVKGKYEVVILILNWLKSSCNIS